MSLVAVTGSILLAQDNISDYQTVIDQYEDNLDSIKSLRYSYSLDYEEDAVYAYQDKKTYTSYRFRLDPKASKANGMKEMVFCDDRFIVVSSQDGILPDEGAIVAQIISFDKKEVSPFINHHCLLGFVHGQPKNTPYIPQLLREYVTSAQKETIEGESLILLKGSKNGLNISAWVNPSKNHALYRIRYQIDEKSSPGGEMVFFDYLPKSFQQFDEHWLPTEYNFDYGVLTMNYDYDDKMNLVPGKITRGDAKYSVKLDNIKVNTTVPEKIFAIKTAIPNGTKVSMLDAPQIEYIWFDGKIEPKTDDLMLRVARGDHGFMPGVREPRFWLMTIGLLLIVIAIYFKVKAMYKRE